MAGGVRFAAVSSPDEVRQILALQAENLADALAADEIAGQGFVTVRHDPAVLQRMNDVAPAVIACADDRVVAYALVMPRAFAAAVPILQPMFAMLERLSWRNGPLRDDPRWFVMGQICVAAGYRGLGVVEGLYATMRAAYRDRFDYTVTEVAERNPRSLRAHERVGFQTLHTYPDETTGEVWRVLVLDF